MRARGVIRHLYALALETKFDEVGVENAWQVAGREFFLAQVNQPSREVLRFLLKHVVAVYLRSARKLLGPWVRLVLTVVRSHWGVKRCILVYHKFPIFHLFNL